MCRYSFTLCSVQAGSRTLSASFNLPLIYIIESYISNYHSRKTNGADLLSRSAPLVVITSAFAIEKALHDEQALIDWFFKRIGHFAQIAGFFIVDLPLTAVKITSAYKDLITVDFHLHTIAAAV